MSPKGGEDGGKHVLRASAELVDGRISGDMGMGMGMGEE